MVKCEKCGAEMLDNAKFCIKCGATAPAITGDSSEIKAVKKAKSPEKKEEKETLCSSCNHPLRKGASFCVSCGTKLEETGKERVEPVNKIIEEAPETLEAKQTAKTQEPSIEKEKAAKKPAAEVEKSKKDSTEKAVATQSKSKQDSPSSSPQKESYEGEELSNWRVTSGAEPAVQADKLDIVDFGKGVVSKITFQEPLSTDHLQLKGKVKCHGCRKISIFSFEANHGWGSSNEPIICPCGNSIEIGEYWSADENAIFIWASLIDKEMGSGDYPLSIEMSKIHSV